MLIICFVFLTIPCNPYAYHWPLLPFQMLTNIAPRVINFIYMRKTLPKILLYRKFFCKRIVCAITNSLMFRGRTNFVCYLLYNVKVMSPSQLGLVFKPIAIFSILNRIWWEFCSTNQQMNIQRIALVIVDWYRKKTYKNTSNVLNFTDCTINFYLNNANTYNILDNNWAHLQTHYSTYQKIDKWIKRNVVSCYIFVSVGRSGFIL